MFDEIVAVKEACGAAHLKVILETGELGTLDRVRRASVLAIHAGADFIKTSTGKIQPAATMPVTLVMLQAIRDHYRATGRMVGMKPAGGIAKAKQAIHYLVMLRETLGEGVAHAGLVPLWREQPRERPADAAREAANRRLPVGRLFLQGLSMARPDTKLRFEQAGSTLRRRRAPITRASTRSTGCSSTGSSSLRASGSTSARSIRRPQSRSRGSRRPTPAMSIAR